MMVKRSWLTAGGAMVGAGILALGLMVATPDSAGARVEVRPVQLASLTLSPSAYVGALQKLITNRVPALAPVAPAPGGADVARVDAAAPTTITQDVQTAALAAPTAGISILDPILGILSPILGLLTNPGALLLFAPIILLVVVACPPCALFNFVTGILGSFVIGLTPVPVVAAAATMAAESTVEQTVEAESSVTAAAPAIDANGAENKKADSASQEQKEQITTEPVTSTERVTESATTEQESTEPKEAETSEPAKPREQQETPRPVVRDSLGADEDQTDPPHRDKGNHENKTTAADAAPKAGGSSDASESKDNADGSN